MNFCWCTITVENMKESLKFYHEIVGLSIDRRFSTGPSGEIVFLGEGETKIELISNDDNRMPDVGNVISLGFEVGSLDDKQKFLRENGIKIESGPFQPNPHVKFFFVRDPNGVRVQFVQNM